jgi:hypothetical protein
MQQKQPNPLDPTIAPSLPVPQFFVDHKKGEVNELRVHLRAVALEKD